MVGLGLYCMNTKEGFPGCVMVKFVYSAVAVSGSSADPLRGNFLLF